VNIISAAAIRARENRRGGGAALPSADLVDARDRGSDNHNWPSISAATAGS